MATKEKQTFIRISETLYTLLQERAKAEERSAANMLAVILKRELGQ